MYTTPTAQELNGRYVHPHLPHYELVQRLAMEQVNALNMKGSYADVVTLAYSIAKQETINFDENAVSRAGAIGMFQIHDWKTVHDLFPNTYRLSAEQKDVLREKRPDLFRIENNARIAIERIARSGRRWMRRFGVREFTPEVVRMISMDYNFGPGNTDKIWAVVRTEKHPNIYRMTIAARDKAPDETTDYTSKVGGNRVYYQRLLHRLAAQDSSD
jgi:hypothetical protein